VSEAWPFAFPKEALCLLLFNSSAMNSQEHLVLLIFYSIAISLFETREILPAFPTLHTVLYLFIGFHCVHMDAYGLR